MQVSCHPVQGDRPPAQGAQRHWQRAWRAEQGGGEEGGGGALQTQVTYEMFNLSKQLQTV